MTAGSVTCMARVTATASSRRCVATAHSMRASRAWHGAGQSVATALGVAREHRTAAAHGTAQVVCGCCAQRETNQSNRWFELDCVHLRVAVVQHLVQQLVDEHKVALDDLHGTTHGIAKHKVDLMTCGGRTRTTRGPCCPAGDKRPQPAALAARRTTHGWLPFVACPQPAANAPPNEAGPRLTEPATHAAHGSAAEQRRARPAARSARCRALCHPRLCCMRLTSSLNSPWQ